MKIIITGTANEGKTTIAKLIADTLRKNGINVKKVIDPDYETLNKIDFQDERLKALKDKNLEVEIETIQIARNGVSSPRIPSQSNETNIYQTRNMSRGRS